MMKVKLTDPINAEHYNDLEVALGLLANYMSITVQPDGENFIDAVEKECDKRKVCMDKAATYNDGLEFMYAFCSLITRQIDEFRVVQNRSN